MCVFVYPSDPLPRSVYLAFKARRCFLGNSMRRHCFYSSLKQCDRAGELLRDSLNVDARDSHYSLKMVSAPSSSIATAAFI